MASPPGRSGVDDRLARLLLTPAFGALVPNLAGLIDHSHHSPAGLVLSYAWFVAVAFLTWEGNLILYLRFQDRTAWLTRPWHRVRLLAGLIGLFTVPFTFVTLTAWRVATEDPAATWGRIGIAVLLVVSAVTFITHVYETVFLVRDWESDRMRNERLQRENLEVELDVLRSEVDPHTLFNNLNALSYLVETGSPDTPAFIGALARSHRYLLQVRARRLVPLSEELSLLDCFVTLIAMRYADGFRVDVQVDPDAARRWMVPPVVLPELLQNAAKHNVLSRGRPLVVTIRMEGDRLLVSNEIRRHPVETEADRGLLSNGVGLSNLARRFRLLAGMPARWVEVGGRFVVTLPLVSRQP